jgi:transposase
VLEIVQLLKTTNMSYIEIAKKYGVKDHIIHFINSGRTWSHLTGLSDENRARPKIRENISKSSIEQIILLYQLTGLGCTSIGKQLNIQPDTAYYHINRYKKNASTQFAYPMNTLGQYVFSDEDTWIGPDLDHPGFYKEYKD